MEKGNKIKTIWSWWERNSQPLVALGTILLALVTIGLAVATFMHIREASEMRKETKRLADLSVEQFKIRAYPSFLIDIEKAYLESDHFIDLIKITNMGEITAHKTTFLWNHLFKKGNQTHWVLHDAAYYETSERTTVIDFEQSIFSRTLKKIANDSTTHPKGFEFKNLSHGLLFVRFKVPYDEKYRYEKYGFVLKPDPDRKDEKSFKWQMLDSITTNNLTDAYFISLGKKLDKDTANKHNKISAFFADYAHQKGMEKKKEGVNKRP